MRKSDKTKIKCHNQRERWSFIYIIVQDKPNSKLLDHKFPFPFFPKISLFSSAKIGKNSLQTATENYHAHII